MAAGLSDSHCLKLSDNNYPDNKKNKNSKKIKKGIDKKRKTIYNTDTIRERKKDTDKLGGDSNENIGAEEDNTEHTDP